MDPLMLAVRRFIQDVDLSFAPPPGAGEPALALRLESTASRRKTIDKALRLREWQPQSRRPLVLVDSATAEAADEQLRGDFEALVEGLGEDGVKLEPYRDAPLASRDPIWEQLRVELEQEGREVTEEVLARRARIERLRRAIVSAGAELRRTGVVDGLTFALVPQGMAEPELFGELAHGLLRDLAADTDQVVRWLVWVGDAPAELPPLVEVHRRIEAQLPRSVRLDVDEPALCDYLRNLEPPNSDGPKLKEVVTTPEQRQRLEKAIGERVASQDTAVTLRRLMLDGGVALGEGSHEKAANKLRAARTLCRLSGLTREEATLLVMVGSAHLSGGDEMRALAAFRDGYELAKENGFVQAQVQALLGTGGTHFAAGRYAEAEQAYAEVVVVAEGQEGLFAIVIEARRMQGNCFEQLGEMAPARERFEQALGAAESMPPQAAHLTAYALAGERLAVLLDQAGDVAGSARVRTRVEAIARRSPAVQEAHP